MRIMVFDVPAEHGGALTILHEYYSKALLDIDNEWYFVVSTPEFADTSNIKIIKYPWVKKSWFHRLYFDMFIAHRIANKYKIDEIISLQNVIIKNVKIKQILYLHQPLPFIEKRFKITENPIFWIYQNIISNMIYSSIREAEQVIVQTEWMKNACLKKTQIQPNKIIIIPPELNIIIKNKYKQEKNNCTLFFYPASELVYKNHKVIVDAVDLLMKANISKFKVVFTLNGNENKNIRQLYQKIISKELPIEFIGKINREQVYDYYSKSILIFPSYIETFGLPLLEAKMHGAPIIASNSEFSREILANYGEADFFDYNHDDDLAALMKKSMKTNNNCY